MIPRIALTAGALALAVLTQPTHAAAAPTTLRFAVAGSSRSPTWVQWFGPWVVRIEKASQGTLKIENYFGYSLANLRNVYDRVESGVADIGFGVVSPLRGKLVGTLVIELPSDANGKEGSASMWHLFESGLTASEWRENKPLLQWVYPQNSMHFQSTVKTMDDIKGMKLATVSKIDAEILTRMGAAPVTVTPAQLYDVVNRHVASAAVIGWTGVMSFKLYEVTHYHLDAPLGSGGGFIVMNKQSYARLPAKAKAAIDANSGYEASKAFGATLDGIYVASKKAVSKMTGQTIGHLSAEEDARWRKVGAPLIDEWVKKTPNGAKFLAAYRAGVLKVRREQ